MSSAVIFVPAIFPGSAVALLAAYVGVGVVVLMSQWLTHATGLSNCREAMSRAVEDVIQEVSRGIKTTTKRVREEISGGVMSAKSVDEITREAAFLQESMLPEILKGLRQGTMVPDDLIPLRQRLEQLDLLVVQHKALFAEQRKRAEFMARKMSALLEGMTSKSQEAKLLESLSHRSREILAIPDAQVEERVAALSEFVAGLQSLSEKTLMRDLVDRLLERTPGFAAGKGPRPLPTSPASAAKDPFDKAVRLKSLQTDVEFYLEKLETDFPGNLTSQMRESAAAALSSTNSQQVSAVRDALRMSWQSSHAELVLSGFFRDRLAGYLQQIPPGDALHAEISDVLQHGRIERTAFTKISLAVESWLGAKIDEERHRMLEENVRKALGSLDYVVLEDDGPAALAARLRISKTAILETKYPDYALMLRLGANDAVTLRLIRIVGREQDKHEVSEYQKKQDAEVKEEWCRNADVFKDFLEEAGVRMVEKLRVEDDVQYFTLEQLDQQNIETAHLRRKRPPSKAEPVTLSKKS